MEAVHHRLAGIFDLAVLNDGDLECRAAHVGGDDIGLVEQLPEHPAADHAGGGPAFEHADRAVGGFLCRK